MKQRAKSTNRVRDIRKSIKEMPVELSVYVDIQMNNVKKQIIKEVLNGRPK